MRGKMMLICGSLILGAVAQESVPELKSASDAGRRKLVPAQLPVRGPAMMNDTAQVYLLVEQMPVFPKGEKGLKRFLDRTVRTPQGAIDHHVSGSVRIAFVVDEEGRILEKRIRRGLGMGCDEEAMRVVEAMPRWEPGMQDGKPVKVWVDMNIPFGAKP